MSNKVALPHPRIGTEVAAGKAADATDAAMTYGHVRRSAEVLGAVVQIDDFATLPVVPDDTAGWSA